MFGPVRNLIFDLDGTLVDSMPGAVQALKGLVEQSLKSEVGDDDFLKTLGKSPQEIFATFLSGEQLQTAIREWHAFNQTISAHQIPLFPGVEQLFDFLAENSSLGVGVFTGRDRSSAERFLKLHAPLSKLIGPDRLRCGDDGFKAKPSGEALMDLLQAQGWTAADTLYIGDHPHDGRAAREAGIKFGAALWDSYLAEGKTSRAKFRSNWTRWDDVDVDLRLNSPINLISWIKSDTLT